jgi:hypothetical protein
MPKDTADGNQTQPAKISNDDFIQEIFGPDAEHAHVTGFLEDPTTLDALDLRHYWGGGPWKTTHGRCRPEHNAFFTISVFRPDPILNQYRRRKANFDRCFVIVIDDVCAKGKVPGKGNSAKVPWDALKLLPSYVLETSPDNLQVGYILPGGGDSRGGKASALLDALVASGLVADNSDPGMKGVTRYVRLPVGRNTKQKYGLKGFKHRLAEWHPSRRYTLEDIADAYGVLAAVDAASDDLGTGKRGVTVDPAADWQLRVLNAVGKVHGERPGSGGELVWDIECPFVDEHSGRADSGSVYLGAGRWDCRHRCSERCDDGSRYHEFDDKLEELYPDVVATERREAMLHPFRGQTFDAGVPARVKAQEDFDAMAAVFGTEAATAYQAKKLLGPFQTRMDAGFSLADAVREGVTTREAWLLKGICPTVGLGVIYGKPGSFKSFIMLDILARSVCGLDWNGHAWKRDGLALYVGSEGGRVGLKHRALAWTREHGASSENLMIYPGAFTLGSGPDSEKEVDLLIKWLLAWSRDTGLPVNMVTLDTLNRNMTGDENSTSDMTAVVQTCDRIARALDCFVWLVHHSGKDEAKGARGSSALRGATDVEIHIERDDATASGTAYLNKNRHGEDGKAWGFDAKTTTLGVDDDGDEISSLVVEWTGSKGGMKRTGPAKLGELETAIVRTFNVLTKDGAVDSVTLDELATATCDAARRGEFPDLNFDTKHPPAEYRRRVNGTLTKKGIFVVDETTQTVRINATDFAQTEGVDGHENA